jgi:hypothetical protein
MRPVAYTPIQKSKAGESRAVIRLDRHTRSDIIPFFDILALKHGVENGALVHEHLEKQAINVAAAWNGRGPCYVDLFDVVPSARGYNGAHPVTIVYEKLSFDRVEAIPVVGLERNIAYKLAIRRAVSEGVEAIAVRLGDEDMQLPSGLSQKIASLVGEVGAAGLPLHIFMDFRSIVNLSSDLLQVRVDRALAEIRKLRPERIVFAASAIVADMGGFKRNSVNNVVRRELLEWKLISERHRGVAFADYGVIHPDYLDIDPKVIRPAGKIRYACDEKWIIVKGIKWVRDTKQHRGLAIMLSKESAFRGADCWGTESIVSAINGGHAYRRLEDWVTIDMNTHITHTVRQLRRVIAKQAVA